MKISIILLVHNDEKNISYEIDSVKRNILDKLEDYEYKLFMMKELGDMLPPLNNTIKKS